MTMKPYKWQARDIKKTLKAPTRGVLNGSIMGAGKTLFAVGVAAEVWKGKSVLIIGPLNTFDGWVKTVADQTESETLQKITSVSGQNHEYTAMKEFMAGVPGWYFVGWETAIRLDYAKFPCQVIIFDEVHRISSHARAHKHGSNAHMAYTVGRKVAVAGGWRIGLSGTWKGNKEEGAWAVERAIWPLQTDASFWRWAKKHLRLRTERIPIRGKLREIQVIGDELDPGSIVKELPMYIRHEENIRCCKAHPRGVQADLPARVIHRVGVDLSPSQRTIYDQLEADMFAWIEENEYPLSSEGYPMVNMLRMHQVCLAIPSTELSKRIKTDKDNGDKVADWYIKVSYPLTATSAKIDALMEIIEDIPSDEQIIVYTHSAGIIPVVVNRLNKICDTAKGWRGDVSALDRAEIKALFIKGSIRIIVAQVAAIAEGVDGLQGVCHNEIWMSMSENNLINQQAVKRLHRPGQGNVINSWQIYARDTLELKQFQRLSVNAAKMQKGLQV